MRRLALLLTMPLLAGACGTEEDRDRAGDRRPPTVERVAPGPPSDAVIRRALGLPPRVPVRATGPGVPEQVAVVRRWLDALSAGRVDAAARLFAVPSRFQNFRSLALIRNRGQALAVTASLPCGARMTKAGGANGFVVYEARLTERPGGDCGAGVGGVVRGAVLVRDGRMAEWYRLPDRSMPRRGERVIPEGPII